MKAPERSPRNTSPKNIFLNKCESTSDSSMSAVGSGTTASVGEGGLGVIWVLDGTSTSTSASTFEGVDFSAVVAGAAGAGAGRVSISRSIS